MSQVSAIDALQKLRNGNQRFVDGNCSLDASLSRTRLDEHLEGQAPYAVVLGCSDSRVPVEIIFDAGIGDLFVIRVAGNVAAPSLVEGVELAAGELGTRLVVVLGHTGCAAVNLTLETLQNGGNDKQGYIRRTVERIRPSLEPLFDEQGSADQDTLLRRAIRANVNAAADGIRQGSPGIERLVQEEGLIVVGAEYSIETGLVDFFDGVPDAA